MKKAVFFLCVLLPFLVSSAGCGSPAVKSSANSNSLSDIPDTDITDDLKLCGKSESPVQLKKALIPQFETHPCRDYASYHKQTKLDNPPQYSNGDIMDYVVSGDQAYFAVAYDSYYHIPSGNLCIFQYDLKELKINKIFTYDDPKKLIEIHDLSCANGKLYWTQSDYAAGNDEEPTDWQIVEFDPGTDMVRKLYEKIMTKCLYPPEITVSPGNLQWLETYDAGDGKRSHALMSQNLPSGKTVKLDSDLYVYSSYIYSSPYPAVSGSTYYRAVQDRQGLIHLKLKDEKRDLDIRTDYQFIDYLGSSKNRFAWINWPAEDDWTDPVVKIYDTAANSIETIDVKKIGVHYSTEFSGKYLFVDVIRDKLSASVANGSHFENVYLVDTDARKIFNLTENTVNNWSSLIGLEYDRLKQRGNCVYFYSRINQNTVSAEYKYLYLYYWNASS